MAAIREEEKQERQRTVKLSVIYKIDVKFLWFLEYIQ